jgi:hypothetical protein
VHEGRWQTDRWGRPRAAGKAPPDIPALKPYWGKPAVRNFRGDHGNGGIIRSPISRHGPTRQVCRPDLVTRDTPVTETTGTYSRRSVLVAATWWSSIGTDVSRFRNASAFASWLGFCPEKRVCGGKMLSCKTRKVKHRAAPGLLSHCRRRAPTTPLVARALVRLRDYAGVSHSLTGPVVVARSISNMQSEANPICGSYALDS